MSNIYQSLAAIMNEVEAIGKNKKNAQQGFMYRGIDDLYNDLQPKFAKHRVFIASEVLDIMREERQGKSGGTLTYTILKVKFTFYAEDGTCVSSVMVGEAMDSGDKGSNKAMSIALKYCLFQLLLIPTEEVKDSDPDAYVHQVSQKGNGAANTPTKGELDMLVKLLEGSTLEPGSDKWKAAFKSIGECRDFTTYQTLQHRLEDLQKEPVNMSQKDINKKLRPVQSN